MADFEALVKEFGAAVEAGEGKRLASLFTRDGVYDDYFFGPHQGHDAIADMVKRFYDGGEQFRWEFFNPLCDGKSGYVQYRFSYVSRAPESAGKVVGFEGISRFELRDGKIMRYCEVFDRGGALAAIGFAPERTSKILNKYWASFRDSAGFAPHRAR